LPHYTPRVSQSAVGGYIRIHLMSLGTPVEIRAAGDRATVLASEIRAAWDFCLTDAPPQAAPVDTIVVDALLDSRPAVVEAAVRRGALAHSTLDTIMHELSPRITLAAMDRQAASLLMFHACGVADVVTGRVLMLVGPSGAGKTTAARALGTAGYAYVSDETVALRGDDAVVSYPKPLSILLGTDSDLKAQVSPISCGFLRAPVDLRLGRIAVLRRDPDAPRVPRVEPVATLPAMGALSPHISYLASRRRPLHRLADVLHLSGGLVRVHYREATDLVPLVPDLLGSER
jgi:hypothetical protein